MYRERGTFVHLPCLPRRVTRCHLTHWFLKYRLLVQCAENEYYIWGSQTCAAVSILHMCL